MPGLSEMHTSEADLLLGYIAQQRDGIINATFGLTDAEAASRPTPSELSLVTLLQHVIDVETGWIELASGTPREPDVARYLDAFADHEVSVAELVDRYRALADETEQTIRRVVAAGGLDQMVPVPRDVPWYPDDVEAWSVRWILLHVIEEVARHAGHADFLREAIDGATMYELMAAVEDWPESPWMTKWQPASDHTPVT